MKYFYETSTHIMGSGVSPHPFTPCQIPEKDGRSRHVKTQQKQKTLWGLGSQGLPYLRFAYQGFISWWTDTLKSAVFCCSPDMATTR